MASQIDAVQAMVELERRGELPGEYRPILQELRNRGIAPPRAEVPVEGSMEAMMVGAGRTADMLGDQITRLQNLTGVGDERRARAESAQAAVDASPRAQEALARLGMRGRITGPLTNEQIDAKETEAQRLMAPLESEYPVSSAVGSALPYMAIPVGLGSRAIGAPLQAAGRMMGSQGLQRAGAGIGSSILADSAITGAGIGAIDTRSDAVTGALSGGLGYAAGRGASRLISPVNDALEGGQRALAGRLKRLGFRFTPGQRTGSQFLQRLEASAESFPVTAGAFSRTGEANQKLANRIMLEAVGETGGSITDEALGKAASRIGRRFDDLTQNVTVNLDDEFINALARLESQAPRVWGRAESPVRALVSDALEEASRGPISGQRYQQLASQMGKEGRRLLRGENSNPELAFAYFDAKEILDDAMERSLGRDARGAFAKAREQWRNLTFLESGKAVNSSSGNVNLRSLAALLRKKDKGGYKRGSNRSPMYEAARFGEGFPPIVGDSGTATRAFLPMMAQSGPGGAATGAVAGGLLGDPVAGATMGASAGLGVPLFMRAAAESYNSPLGRAYLGNRLIQEPGRRAIGGLLGRGAAGSGLLAD